MTNMSLTVFSRSKLRLFQMVYDKLKNVSVRMVKCLGFVAKYVLLRLLVFGQFRPVYNTTYL